MKRLFSLAVLCCLFFGALSAQENYEVKQSNYSGVEIKFVSSPIQVSGALCNGQHYTSISMNGFLSQSEAGLPALPTLIKLMEMPLGNGLTYDILSMVCDTVDGASLQVKNQVIPAQLPQRKSGNRTAPFMKNETVYSTNTFCGESPITLHQVGVARDINLTEIHFNPMQWNPVTNQFIIIKEMNVRVRMSQPDIAATNEMKALHHSGAFGSGINTINSIGPKAVNTTAPLRYMIVSHSSFRDKLDEFVNWKKRQGFLVDIVYTDDPTVGSDTAHIRAFLRSQYTNATANNPAPTFVLLVGDNEQIPAYRCTTGSGWSASTHYSDLYYMTWSNGDIIPDCYYGRFSAQNINQLTPQIEKTLLYEQYAFDDPSYLSKSALVAGVDGGNPGDHGYTHADPAMDYAAKTYINAANGFPTVYYYKNNTNIVPTGVTVTGSSQASGTAATLRGLYNDGIGWINYSAHGDVEEWYSPSLTVNHVSSMTNDGKPSIMIGNCCLSCSFQESNCLGEALLRKNNNAGAAAYFGGSDYTYWDEDFYWSVGVRTVINANMNPTYDANHLGMYDRLFHTHGEAYSDWYTCAGALNMSGNMAVQSSNSTLKNYYWEVYHLMGDPSLLPWLGEASDMTVSCSPAVLMVGSSSLNVEAAPYAYVALTDANHNLLGAAFADANGHASLSFPNINIPGNYELAVSAQNYKPSFTQIQAIVADGPYLMIDSLWTMNPAVVGDTIGLSLNMKNIGNDPVSQYSIEFITEGSNLLPIIQGQDTINATIAADANVTVERPKACFVWNDVSDGTETTITAIVRWGNHYNELSRATTTIAIKAPKLGIKSHSFSSDITENSTVTLNITNKNLGHATANNLSSRLICPDPCITVAEANPTTQALTEGSVWNVSYTLTIGDNLPESGRIPLFQKVTFNGRNHTDTIWISFGAGSEEGFESNTISEIWSNGTYPWTITNDEHHSGNYCIRSADMGNSGFYENKTSKISITWTSTVADSLSFWHKVSSESNYDWFRFYIDGTLMEQSSGPNNDWERSAYFITEGTHTFEFSYEKDYSVNNGSDCAWVDDITLPQTGTIRTYALDTICEGRSYTFQDSLIIGLEAGSYTYHHSGPAHEYYLLLEVSPTPTISIEASATEIRKGEPVLLKATGADQYLWSTGETTEMFYAYPVETTDYNVTGWVNGCHGSASITILVNGTIGIEGIEMANVQVFPNPATDHLLVKAEGMANVALYNAIGQKIQDLSIMRDEASLNIQSMVNGVYIIRITMQNGDIVTKKIIKR